jgi:NADH-quinone oxidoreductase subunit M
VQTGAPVLAGVFLVAGLSSLSLPGLSPFVSEFLVMTGAFVHNWWYAVFSVLGIVLAALYILLMYQRTMTGPVRPGVEAVVDLRAREVAAVAPLLVLIIGLGFFPRPLIDVLQPAVRTTLAGVGAEDPAPAVSPAAAQEAAK